MAPQKRKTTRQNEVQQQREKRSRSAAVNPSTSGDSNASLNTNASSSSSQQRLGLFDRSLLGIISGEVAKSNYTNEQKTIAKARLDSLKLQVGNNNFPTARLTSINGKSKDYSSILNFVMFKEPVPKTKVAVQLKLEEKLLYYKLTI